MREFLTDYLVPGVIITGMVKVDEVFNINNNKICRFHGLLVGGRKGHSICGHLLCGGHDTRQSCLMLNTLTGEFTPTSVRLKGKRHGHLCWDVEGENGPALLMGGSIYSERSTELVSSDGSSSSASFNLTYDTR